MGNERKSIFITGGASGMGRETARLFAGHGWFVGIYDVNVKGLEILASEIGRQNCHFAGLDVTDRSAYQSVLEDFDEKAGGRMDVMFNNAGIIQGGLFGQMDLSDFERVIQVNFMGVVNGIHMAYPMLKKTPNSLCFITSSSSAIYGAPYLTAYSASKYALRGLTEALSIEFAIIDSRVADALPGHVVTGMMTDEYQNQLPKEGPWRPLPAESVANVVWASYHDKSGKLHWFVPDDLEDYYKTIASDVEAERDLRRKQFVKEVKLFVERNKN